LISDNEDKEAKRIADLQRGFQEKAEEAARLKEQMENLKAQADQAGAIKELVETLKPKEEPQTPQWDAIEKDFIDKGWDEDEARKQVQSLQIAAAWQQQGEEQVRSSVLSEVEALKAQLAEERNQRVKLTADYTENQELVDEFVGGGMEINAAIAMAKKVSAQMPAKAPDRATPPPATGGGRIPQEAVKPATFLSEDERQRVIDMHIRFGSTPEEAARLADVQEAEAKARNGGA
jgi:chromosome segregation ATPase